MKRNLNWIDKALHAAVIAMISWLVKSNIQLQKDVAVIKFAVFGIAENIPKLKALPKPEAQLAVPLFSPVK